MQDQFRNTSRMLKKAASFVLASLGGSTYGLGKRLFPQTMGGRVKTVYASPPRSLRPRRTAFLNFLRAFPGRSNRSGSNTFCLAHDMHNDHDMTSTLARLVLVLIVAAGLLLARATGTIAADESSPDSLIKQGLEAYQRGSFDQALAAWKQAAGLYEHSGKVKEQSQALVLAAQASESIGQVNQALQQLEVALALAEQTQERAWIATVQENLGRTYLAARNPDAATQHLTKALEMATAENNTRLIAAIHNDLGLAKVSQHHHEEALASFSASAQGALEAGDRPLAVRAQVNAARVALKLDQPEAARNWLDQALEGVKDLEPSHDKATALIQIGLGYQQLLPATEDSMHAPLVLRAAGGYVEAATMAEKIGDTRTLSYAQGYLGHLYETEHRNDEALRLTRRAVFSAQAANAPESLYRWQWQLGRLLAASGQIDEALASYNYATETLRPIRIEVASALSSGSVSGEESVRPLYFEMSDLLLNRAALTPDAKVAEDYLRRARDAIEAYKAAELRDYFRDECVDALQARLTKLDTVDPTTAVIYPIVFSDRTELLVSLPTGLMRVSVPVTAPVLTKEVRAFRRLVEKRTTREYLPHSQQLYEWLIHPIESELIRQKIQTLVFVPDGVLRTIPLSALHDGTSFLIQKYAVALTPGLYLTDPRPLDRKNIRFLAGGLTTSVQGFPSLPYVAEEVENIRTLYQADQLLNQQFRTPLLEQELRESRYGILHIATHGKFSTDANDSFLLTFDGKLTMSTLDRLIGLFRFRQDPLELLTLSACQTAVGDDRAALGLAGVAIKAGARSALATLWYINDEASAALIGEFYRQLREPGVSKATAVQQAQLKLLRDRVYEHPAYWSPFLLLNNWL
jgi:CHAT domain-containing protein